MQQTDNCNLSDESSSFSKLRFIYPLELKLYEISFDATVSVFLLLLFFLCFLFLSTNTCDIFYRRQLLIFLMGVWIDKRYFTHIGLKISSNYCALQNVPSFWSNPPFPWPKPIKQYFISRFIFWWRTVATHVLVHHPFSCFPLWHLALFLMFLSTIWCLDVSFLLGVFKDSERQLSMS